MVGCLTILCRIISQGIDKMPFAAYRSDVDKTLRICELT